MGESGLVSSAEDEALAQAHLLRPRRGESRTRRASDESPTQRGGGARPRGQHLKGFRYDEAAGLAYFSVYLPGGGARHRATVEAATWEEAVHKWTEFRARALKGEARPGHVLTFREYIAAYMDDIATQVSAKTATEYRRTATKHLLPVFGSTRLNEITTAAVKAFETKLKRAGYALATVNGYVNVLLILLHRAVDDFDVIEEFPLEKRLKRQKLEPLALEFTDEESARFFAAFDDEAELGVHLAVRRTLGVVRTCERYPRDASAARKRWEPSSGTPAPTVAVWFPLRGLGGLREVRTKMNAMRVLALTLLLFAASVEAQFTQQGSKLRAQGGSAAALGTSVALSADGNTAVVGGPASQAQIGGVWIFTRNGKVWSQQGPKLVGTGGGNAARQGSSVAVSADGNTVIFGAIRDRGSEGEFLGAAWVFTRVAGVWSQQGTKLVGTGAVGGAEQGSAVALSADGNTAIIGGPSDNGSQGAAWIFTRTGDTWTQQGSKLVGTFPSAPSAQGFAVALSGDGNTAIIGGPQGTDGGAVWIFTRANGAWVQQGLRIIAFSGVGNVRYGTSVALSYDGNTAIVGGPGDVDRGSVWVYTRANSEWTQQGPKLSGTSENPGASQGTSVSLSADGNTAVIGGPQDHPQGGIWVFIRNGDVWSEQGSKLVGTGAATQFGPPLQGRAVAISGNAKTIIEAGSGDTSETGSVWPFSKAVPTIATFTGNGQSAQINAAYAPLSVIVRDASDQPSSNASVTFAVHGGPSGAGGTFGSSTTVLTNADGIATAPTLTANATIGGFTVTASTASGPASATFDLANAALPAPTNVTATTTPQSTIAVNWTASNGATHYEVERALDGVTYTSRTITSATSFVDSSGIGNNSGYLYRVRAIEPGLSSFSVPDIATVVSLTDPALTSGATIKAVHFMELRNAVTVVRALAALDSYGYTDPNLQGEPVKAIHLTELRFALGEARARLMLPAVLYTRPTITAGSTFIAATDVLDLRSGVQ